MKHCQLCGSGRTKLSNDVLFCANCEIYFALKNGNQLIKSLPITETKQRSLSLCSGCTKKAMKNSIIRCRFFKEYLKRLPFCRSCKSANHDYLKNLFFKNFLLYKRIKRVFGLSTLLMLIGLWLFSDRCIVLFYYYLEIYLGSLSFKKIILTSIVFYHLNMYSFARAILFLICLYKVLFKKRTVFEIPINLLDPHELDSFIDRLSIKNGIEKKIDASRWIYN